MNFRRANNIDISAIKAVVFSVLGEYGLKPDPTDTDSDLGDLEMFYFSKGGYFEVCELDGQVIGTWGIYALDEKNCELRKMYLLSSQRGKGLGKAILDRALVKARELGFIRVELETASVLKEAIGLYEKRGFKPISGRHLATRCDQAFELFL